MAGSQFTPRSSCILRLVWLYPPGRRQRHKLPQCTVCLNTGLVLCQSDKRAVKTNDLRRLPDLPLTGWDRVPVTNHFKTCGLCCEETKGQQWIPFPVKLWACADCLRDCGQVVQSLIGMGKNHRSKRDSQVSNKTLQYKELVDRIREDPTTIPPQFHHPLLLPNSDQFSDMEKENAKRDVRETIQECRRTSAPNPDNHKYSVRA